MKDFAGHSRQFTALPALLALVVAAACTETGDLRTTETTAAAEPQPLRLFPGAPHAWAADMSVFPDGQRLYFMGAHPVDAAGTRSDLNIWVGRRVDGAWATAEPLPYPVNTAFDEVYSSVVADGSLYFTAYSTSEAASGRSGLYRAQALNDGGFAEPVKVDIEWAHRIGDTLVAPDESYLSLSARLPGSDRGEDLHGSFCNAEGGWDEPINPGPAINSDGSDYFPMVTPDGTYLFFSRSRADPPWGWSNVVAGDIYWVDTAVIDRLRPSATDGR